MSKKALPNKIYVAIRVGESHDLIGGSGGSTYLQARAEADSDDFAHGDVVGVYELKETRVVSVVRTLV